MIPKGTEDLKQGFEIIEQPSNTYRMADDVISGKVDGIEAMEQAIYKILNTERYDHAIYSWNYGIELEDLFGQPADYVCPELKRRITEALTQDSRIHSVDSFVFEVRKKRISVTFTAHTIFGDVTTERQVQI